ncbi:hypothetical protein ABZ519_19310 [Streptomyces collinus]|uniref:hypothetical protein n=1 Tax=Streptomyces collinus TaxID=42684 RepID=UPI0033F9042A
MTFLVKSVARITGMYIVTKQSEPRMSAGSSGLQQLGVDGGPVVAEGDVGGAATPVITPRAWSMTLRHCMAACIW